MPNGARGKHGKTTGGDSLLNPAKNWTPAARTGRLHPADRNNDQVDRRPPAAANCANQKESAVKEEGLKKLISVVSA